MKHLIPLLFLLISAPAAAQAPPAPPSQPTEQAQPSANAEAAPKGMITVRVAVKHGADDRPVANTPVFLQAARARGPFEPTAPKAQFEWEGFTDAAGIATFDRIPSDLTTSGLKLHAVTTYDGLAFESPASAPADGTTISAKVWDKGLDTSVVSIKNLRSVVEVWENYLVFTQFYTLTNTGLTALDVKLLPEEDYEKGLPFELPVKAQAINVTGPGESVVVNSTFYWKGVLEPGSSVNLQVRFSMSAKDPEFVYEQRVDYPTQNVEVVVPIQTRFQKLPRLHDLELRPLGFSETDKGPGIFDLRPDMEFIGARGLELEAGKSFSFQIRGLPFHRPTLPWYFLGLGLLCGLVVVVLARRERKTRAANDELAKVFEGQRVELLDALVAVEKDLEDGVITRAEAEFESSALREQLALVLKKLEDLAAKS